MILTAFTSYSQNTIQITKNQAKQAIRTAQKLETANKLLESKDVVISSQKRIIIDKDLMISNLNAEISLLNENNKIYKSKNNLSTFEVILIIASFGLGFIIGK